MNIEPITLNDINETIEVIRESFEVLVAPTWSESGIKTFLEDDLSPIKIHDFVANGNICLKYTKSDLICGVLLFSSLRKLAHLFVLPKYQRCGIAKTLFQEAKYRMVDDAEIDYIEITSSEYAISAYQKLGFKKSARAFIYNGCQFQPMVYWLGTDRIADDVEFVS